MRKSLLIGIVGLLLSLAAQGQYHKIVPYFFGEVDGTSIHLRWAVSGGNTCNGIHIYHSLDDSVYTKVGEIPGICGDAAADIDYEFEHENIQHSGDHYYKLELGFQGFSLPLMVRYYFLEKGYVLFPNPGGEEFSLVLKRGQEGAVLDVFDLRGQLLLSRDLSVEQSERVDMRNYPAGMYMLMVRDDKQVLHKIKWIKQ